jgi:hypothetical protein
LGHRRRLKQRKLNAFGKRVPRLAESNFKHLRERGRRGTHKKLEALAEKFYTKDPTDAELAEAGLTREDFASEILEVFPDNETAFSVFCSLSTQWRTAFQGYIGLDYNVLFARLDRMKLDADERNELESDVSTLERAALHFLNKPAD